MQLSLWRVTVIIAICILAAACVPNSPTRQQQQYARVVANDVVTKFLVRDPSDPEHILGVYAVVNAQQNDPGAIFCTYRPPRQPGNPSTDVSPASAINSYVRLFKIESRMEQNQIYYEPLASNDALQVMHRAPTDGEGLSKIAELLGTRRDGYDPFPLDAQGERTFLFTGCRIPA